jgi:hypothetical protein
MCIVKVSIICCFCLLRLYNYVDGFKCLVTGLSVQCAVFLMSDQLHYMCVLCQVCVGHIFGSVNFFSHLGYIPYTRIKRTSRFSDIF